MILNDISNDPSEPVSPGMPWHGPVIGNTLYLPNGGTKSITFTEGTTGIFGRSRGRTWYVKFAGLPPAPVMTPEEIAEGKSYKLDAVLYGRNRQYYNSTRTIDNLFRDTHGIVWHLRIGHALPIELDTAGVSSGSATIAIYATRFGEIRVPSVTYPEEVILVDVSTIALGPSLIAFGSYKFRSIMTDLDGSWVLAPDHDSPSPDGSKILIISWFRLYRYGAETYGPWIILKIQQANITSGANPGDKPTASIVVVRDEETCCGGTSSSTGGDPAIWQSGAWEILGYQRLGGICNLNIGGGEGFTYVSSYTSSTSFWSTRNAAFDAEGTLIIWTLTADQYSSSDGNQTECSAEGEIAYNPSTDEWEGDGYFDSTNSGEGNMTKSVTVSNGSQSFTYSESTESFYTRHWWGDKDHHDGVMEDDDGYSLSNSLGGTITARLNGDDRVTTGWWPTTPDLYSMMEKYFYTPRVEPSTNNTVLARMYVADGSDVRWYDVILTPSQKEVIGLRPYSDPLPCISWNPRTDTLAYSYTDTLSFV